MGGWVLPKIGPLPWPAPLLLLGLMHGGPLVQKPEPHPPAGRYQGPTVQRTKSSQEPGPGPELFQEPPPPWCDFWVALRSSMTLSGPQVGRSEKELGGGWEWHLLWSPSSARGVLASGWGLCEGSGGAKEHTIPPGLGQPAAREPKRGLSRELRGTFTAPNRLIPNSRSDDQRTECQRPVHHRHVQNRARGGIWAPD